MSSRGYSPRYSPRSEAALRVDSKQLVTLPSFTHHQVQARQVRLLGECVRFRHDGGANARARRAASRRGLRRAGPRSRRDHARAHSRGCGESHLDVSQVCSTRSRVLEIDLATATPADLRFSSKFTLKATRQVALDCPPPPARATTTASVHVAGFRPRDRRLLRHLILRVPQDGGTVD